jgi:hypothetical protein
VARGEVTDGLWGPWIVPTILALVETECGISRHFNSLRRRKKQTDQGLAAFRRMALTMLNRRPTGLRAAFSELGCITKPELPDINQQLRREGGGKDVIAKSCYSEDLWAISR